LKHSSISTAQLAKICGVSQGTVDRALNNRKGINPQTRERILAAAKEYGYRPNIHARSMAGGRSSLIGVVVFDLDNQYFSDFLTSLSKCCDEQGYSTVVMFTEKDPGKELECIRSLYRMSVDGIVLCPIHSGEEYENYLLSLEIPIVTIGNRLCRFPHAGIDDRLAMAEATEYVLSRGYDHLIYVKPRLGQQNTSAQTLRLEAFLETTAAASAAVTVAAPDTAEASLLPHRQNVFICPTDVYALRLLRVARENAAGILGFDNLRLLDQLDIRLDSVSYDVSQAARLAAAYIIDGTPVTAPVRHTLILRGSI